MTPPMSQPEQLWELKITASGMVHDADGNLISGDVPVESVILVNEQQARALIEGNDPQ